MSTEIFSVDLLLGESTPVFKFSIRDTVHEAYASNDLPERYQIRLLEAETVFAEVSEEIQPKLEKIELALDKADVELKKIQEQDKDVPTLLSLKIRTLQQKESSLNAQLVEPARNAIEAMCQLEKGALSSLPIKATNALYSKIMDALYKKPTDASPESDEGKLTTESDSTAT